MIMSIVAVYKESFYRSAYIWCEISYGANLVIVIIFWGVLWQTITDAIAKANTTDPDGENYMSPETVTFFKVY